MSRHHVEELRRRRTWTKCLEVDEGVAREAGDEHLVLSLPPYLARDFESDALLRLHPRADLENVVVVRACVVVALGVGDGKPPSFLLAFAVGIAAVAHKLVARALEHRQVVAVVDDAHHVGVGIRNAVLDRDLLHVRLIISKTPLIGQPRQIRRGRSGAAGLLCTKTRYASIAAITHIRFHMCWQIRFARGALRSHPIDFT